MRESTTLFHITTPTTGPPHTKTAPPLSLFLQVRFLLSMGLNSSAANLTADANFTAALRAACEANLLAGLAQVRARAPGRPSREGVGGRGEAGRTQLGGAPPLSPIWRGGGCTRRACTSQGPRAAQVSHFALEESPAPERRLQVLGHPGRRRLADLSPGEAATSFEAAGFEAAGFDAAAPPPPRELRRWGFGPGGLLDHVLSPLGRVPPPFLSFFTRNDGSLSSLGTPTASMPAPKPTLPSHDHHRVPGELYLLVTIEIT